MHCACGNAQPFESCCGPYLAGDAQPPTAEALMRSRYTAFTVANMDYITKTLAPEGRKHFDAKATQEWAEKAKWKRLEILNTDKGGPDDNQGVVEFNAVYELNGEGIEHHEVSYFKKNKQGHWLFVDGQSHTHKEGEGHHEHPVQETVVRTEAKIGRNDPCPCGSGKKYKKCCGSAA